MMDNCDHIGLMLTIFLMGIKHGFDADHIAAIDGLTRPDRRAAQSTGRNAGVLFSFGHGAVVTLAAVAVSTSSSSWQVPHWLESGGAWISIVTLLLLAAINISTAVSTRPNDTIVANGWRSKLLRCLFKGSGPWTSFGVGALFALSFDTLTQAALFGVTAATHFGGWYGAVWMAALFVAGMLVTAGANGLWISKLMQGSTKTALIASRVMVLAVAGVSLITAASGIATRLLPAAHPLIANKAAWLSLAIVIIVLTSYGVGLWMAKFDGRSIQLAGRP